MKAGARHWARRIATVGGVGYLPWAPGTWGSVVGVLLGVPIARTIPWPLSALLFAGMFVCCALICTDAARTLNQHDPPAVVLDEVWAMSAILAAFPLAASSWRWLLVAFLLFRFFDVIKPFPLKRLALLPAGWGILADDLGAAVYTYLLLKIAVRLMG